MTFKSDKFVLLRGALPTETARLLECYVSKLNRQKVFDWHVETASWDRYADPIGELLLVKLKPAIEEAVGYRLLPTYSYLREYSQGSSLRKHSDRPSCEVSATICVAFTPRVPWAINIESGGGALAIELNPGDMLLYMGCLVNHWRTPFVGESQVQLFLHYVIADGNLREFEFDLRRRLGLQPPLSEANANLCFFNRIEASNAHSSEKFPMPAIACRYAGMYKIEPYVVVKITALDGSLYFELFEKNLRTGLVALRPRTIPTDFDSQIGISFHFDPVDEGLCFIDFGETQCCSQKIIYP